MSIGTLLLIIKIMETIQLINIIRNDKYARKYFCGVIPIDHLPNEKLSETCNFIVNTDKSTGRGKHWIAIYAPMNGLVEYFDPFGIKPLNEEIYEFIRKNSSNYLYNNHPIQHLTSIKCGLFCLFFILTRSRGIPMMKSTEFFSNISYLNDELIDIIFKKIKYKFKIKKFI